jgi:glycosyltransferase involved in cell wall biosynthesis
MKLSILIPTIDGREKQFDALHDVLDAQVGHRDDVEVCIIKDNKEMSIGAKRNKLLEMANGKYVAFIDDDDMVSGNYVELLLEAIEQDVDCASLMGEYIIDGCFDGVFEHSIKYKEWRTTDNEIKYERFPNHLNAIRASIAKRFKFPGKNFSEDFDWSTAIHQSGLLKTEHYIPEIIYYYKYVSNK